MSLMEIMVTLGLFLVFLAAAGGLVSKASRVLRFSEGKASSLRALTFALDRLVSDISGAQSIITPNSGSANSLSLTMIDPSNTERLLPAVGLPTLPVVKLNLAKFMQQIDYTVVDQHLLRVVSRSGSNISQSRVAERIVSLECTRTTNDLMELKIQIQEERGPRTVSTAVPLLVGVP